MENETTDFIRQRIESGVVTGVHTVKGRRADESVLLRDGHTVKGKHVHSSEPLTVDHTVKRHTR